MKLLFVCLGNICRSPAAEHSLRSHAKSNGLVVQVESCGIGEWHVGKGAFEAMEEAANKRGIDLTSHKARCIKLSDFYEFDYLITMDTDILQKVLTMAPQDSTAKVLSYLVDNNGHAASVPDPYYTKDFDGAMQLILESRTALINRIHSLGRQATNLKG